MNSTNIIAAGTSQSAKAIQGFSPTVMPPQTVTKSEIDAVFTYIDTYIAPVAANTTSAGSTSPDSEKKVIKKRALLFSLLKIFNKKTLLLSFTVSLVLLSSLAHSLTPRRARDTTPLPPSRSASQERRTSLCIVLPRETTTEEKEEALSNSRFLHRARRRSSPNPS